MSTLARRNATRRQGKTLIEMVVVITTSSVLVSLSAGLFHEMAQTDRLFRDATAHGTTQMRLARMFRRDVRASSTLQILAAEEGPRLRLAKKEGMVTYTPVEEGLRRERQGASGMHRDLFRLGRVTVQFDKADGLATLSVASKKSARPDGRWPGASFQVIAAIGADVFQIEQESRGGQRQPVRAPRPPVQAPRPEEGSS